MESAQCSRFAPGSSVIGIVATQPCDIIDYARIAPYFVDVAAMEIL